MPPATPSTPLVQQDPRIDRLDSVVAHGVGRRRASVAESGVGDSGPLFGVVASPQIITVNQRFILGPPELREGAEFLSLTDPGGVRAEAHAADLEHVLFLVRILDDRSNHRLEVKGHERAHRPHVCWLADPAFLDQRPPRDARPRRGRRPRPSLLRARRRLELTRFRGHLGLAPVSLTRFSGIDTALEPSRGGDMPKRYPPEFRHRVLELVKAGRSVSEVASDLGVSSQAIYNWRRQAEIDAGLRPGVSSTEHPTLRGQARLLCRLGCVLAQEWSAGRSTPAKPRRWSPTPWVWRSRTDHPIPA